jgi:hypothetical protein
MDPSTEVTECIFLTGLLQKILPLLFTPKNKERFILRNVKVSSVSDDEQCPKY